MSYGYIHLCVPVLSPATHDPLSATLQTAMQLIVGLGNPGLQYEATRHNAGAWFIQAITQHYASDLRLDKKLQGSTCQTTIAAQQPRLFVPTTFMNHSGQAVAAIANFYKIEPHHILVAQDELDLPVGDIKLKKGGGHGGHNGLRDIITCLNSNDFYRLRIGIGHPGHRDRVHDYVLNRPTRDEAERIHQAIAEAIAILPDIVNGELDRATRNLHSQER